VKENQLFWFDQAINYKQQRTTIVLKSIRLPNYKPLLSQYKQF